MDVLSDLEKEAKTDPGEDTYQPALFSEEVASDKENITSQVASDSPALDSGSSCTYCGRRVDTDDDATHKEVRTWVSGPKKDSAVLRTYTGRYACGDCVSKLRAGIAPDQPELEALLDTTPTTSNVGEILTDRSLAYNSGYSDGLEGRPGDAARLHLIGSDVYDYTEGFEVGKELRATQEWFGSTGPSVGINEGPFVYIDDDLPY